MKSYIKSGHDRVVSTWFSFSTISCWHWILTSVFVVTVTPSPHSAYCILLLWTCHFSASCQKNTFYWGLVISVLCSQTPSLLIHLYFSTSCRPWNSARNYHMTSFHSGISEHNWCILAFPGDRAWQRTTRTLRDPVVSNSFLLQSLPVFWKTSLLILWPLKVFPLLPSLPACPTWFSVSLVDFPLYPWCLLFLLSLTYRTSLMLVLSSNLFSCHRIIREKNPSYDFNFHFFVTPKSQFLFFIFLLDSSL